MQVARLGSVKAAAEELALSSPALSRRIQALERFLNLQLFDRAPGAMRLNGDGGVPAAMRLLVKPYRKADLARILREVLDG